MGVVNEYCSNVDPGLEAVVRTAGLSRETGVSNPVKSGSEEARAGRLDKELVEALVIFSLLCDFVLAAVALTSAFWLCFNTGIAQWLGNPNVTLSSYACYIAFGTFLLGLSLSLFGIYRGSLLLAKRQVVSRVAQACLIWLAGLLSFSVAFQLQPHLSRLFVATAGVNAAVILILWRIAFHSFLRRSRSFARLQQRILFVGWNEEAKQLVEAFAAGCNPGYEVVGYVSRDGAQASAVDAPPVHELGSVGDISGILQEGNIDIVIMADCDSPKAEIVQIAKLCENEMVEFQMIPSYFQILISGMHVDAIGGVPVLGISRLPLDRIPNQLLKRAIDIVGSGMGLVLSFPVIVICGALIYLESPGAVFFAQERIGCRGRRFKMFKLRSMRPGGEASDHLRQSTMPGDARLLKIGAVLRRWNLDELPQFWNVLRGDMSLVGPRPERTYHSQSLRDIIPHYNARYIAKPGITGWAQVNGLRGATDLTERVRYDLYYIENWNVLLDIMIMAKTFLVHNGV